MKLHSLAVATACLLAFGWPAARAEEPASDDSMKGTVQMLREAGRELYSWIQENHPRQGDPGSEGPEVCDWSECAAIALDDVERRTGLDLPATDAWGGSLEYCLDIENLETGFHVLGIRSRGADGAFEGAEYSPGPFDPEVSPGTDLVWMDGYFVTWPQRSEPGS